MNAATGEDVASLQLLSDEHYRALAERHRALDDRLASLVLRHHLSEGEQLEEATLKKEKLALKDRMAEMARHWSSQHRSSA